LCSNQRTKSKGQTAMIVTVGFWLGVFVLFYVYGGYYGFLTLLSRLKRKEKSLTHKTPKNDCLPAVSIVITVFNEEQNIRKRIENLMHVDYDPKKVEVIVASDGSADRTVELARQSNYPNIVVLDFKVRRGKALTQNDAVAAARGDIVVFSDANTEFHQDFLKNITRYFSDGTVGCVVGNLVYRVGTSVVSSSEGFYWRFEKSIRELESRLGILATATGASMAVRKSLWRPLSPSDDSDFTTPLDVILQGYSVLFAFDALAFDEPADSPRQEFRTRVRQTSKNLAGTIRRWGWKGVLRHPAVTFGLLDF
jgi:cellulose synthase/poly-beta-1,6-N-acetylglucosamine synthase-like glycosyltransferase